MASHRGKQQEPAEIVSLMFRMGRLVRDKMHKAGNNELSNSLLAFEALRYVGENDRPYMRDVARNFMVTPPAATLIIDNLVKEKLLVRVMDERDRRSVRISLTQKGKQLFEKNMKQKAAQFKKMFGGLTPAERKQFSNLLKKVINHNS